MSPAAAARRTSCQATLVACLDALPRLLAPVLPHLAEELWQALPYVAGEPYADRASVFDFDAFRDGPGGLAPFPAHEEARWAAVRALRDDANRALEAARRDKVLGASLDGELVVAGANATLLEALAPLRGPSTFAPHAAAPGESGADVDDLRFLLLVSAVTFADDADAANGLAHVVPAAESLTGAAVGAAPAAAPRCARCWYHDATVGNSDDHPLLCARCDAAVASA